MPPKSFYPDPAADEEGLYDEPQQFTEPQSIYQQTIASTSRHPFHHTGSQTTSSTSNQRIYGGIESFSSYPLSEGYSHELHPGLAGASGVRHNHNPDQGFLPPYGPTSYTGKRTIASTFDGAHDFSISGNPSFVNIGEQKTKRVKVIHYNGAHVLDTLKEFVAFNALHGSSAQDPERRCHPGTREDVLKQMRNWVNDPDTVKRILWLHGPAGAGKSAIAQTIAHSFDRDKVAATFFFFRSDSTRRDGNLLFPTLAWQLAISIPELRDHVIQALNRNPDLPRKAIEIQFEQLIIRPFQALAKVTPQLQTLTQVIVIDGVDECQDEKLQRRFLKIIGNAVADNHFPLRFLISSRPEAHIHEAFNPFQSTTLCIDLANIDGSYRDVEKYLTDQFARIASEHRLDPLTWPSEGTIKCFAKKSSGQFIYASTIIEFIGDEYSSANSRLDIIMGLEPTNGESLFANLDALYMEILERQPHQPFLKDFLALLVASSQVSFRGSVAKDDALLLNIRESELHRKLRGMHSLLKFTPHIDVHHRSFLDFLGDVTRSSKYHVSKRGGIKRYFELITETLVRYASRVVKQYDYHETDHFQPKFRPIFRYYPRRIELPLSDWEEVLQPLFNIQSSFLEISPHRKHDFCKECAISDMVDELVLKLMIFRAASHPMSAPLQYHPYVLNRAKGAVGLDEGQFVNLMEVQNVRQKGINDFLSPLLSCIRMINSRPEEMVVATDLLCALLKFDSTETAQMITAASDAQSLIEFILYFAENRRSLNDYYSDIGRNAVLLALEIYTRVPVPPRSLFLNRDYVMADSNLMEDYPEPSTAYLECQQILISGLLVHSNIHPSLGVYEEMESTAVVIVFPYAEYLVKWRKKSRRCAAEVMTCILDVAKALQYLHSLGIMRLSPIKEEDVVVDSNSRAKLLPLSLYYPPPYDNTPSKDDLFWFGCFFYEIYFNIEVPYCDQLCLKKRDVTVKRPHEPKIRDDAWELIQECCAEDPESRPTMDEVVAKMESWKLRRC